jgi:hypothetical protein
MLRITAQESTIRDAFPFDTYRGPHDECCSVNVTDLADIFTVGRPKKVRKNPKNFISNGRVVLEI